MGDTMNTEVEVTTKVSEVEEPIQEIDIEEVSGPSNGFIALVIGAVAAVAVGVTVGIRRHKKKKAEAAKAMVEIDKAEHFSRRMDELSERSDIVNFESDAK